MEPYLAILWGLLVDNISYNLSYDSLIWLFFQIQVYQEVKANARDAVINLVSSLRLDAGFL